MKLFGSYELFCWMCSLLGLLVCLLSTIYKFVLDTEGIALHVIEKESEGTNERTEVHAVNRRFLPFQSSFFSCVGKLEFEITIPVAKYDTDVCGPIVLKGIDNSYWFHCVRVRNVTTIRTERWLNQFSKWGKDYRTVRYSSKQRKFPCGNDVQCQCSRESSWFVVPNVFKKNERRNAHTTTTDKPALVAIDCFIPFFHY